MPRITISGYLFVSTLALVVGVVLGNRVLPPGSLLGVDPGDAAHRPIVHLSEIRQIAELAVAETTPVVEFNKERFPNGGRKQLGLNEDVTLVVSAKVKAGFDLSQLSESDLWADGSRVQLHLPPPKVLSTTIDWSSTYVKDHNKSFLIGADPNLPVEALAEGTNLINEEAVQYGILPQAEKDGLLAYENEFRKLGFEQIRIGIN